LTVSIANGTCYIP